jgi:ribosomal protein S18 acetylase RimI-like enzyme
MSTPGSSGPVGAEVELRHLDGAMELNSLEPLWDALQEHHAKISPELDARTPKREAADAWRIRRAKYERWLKDPATFVVIAEGGGRPIGYAFVTVGAPFASWDTGERLAQLETLSVLPDQRGKGIGLALLRSVREQLAEEGVESMSITTTTTNVDAQRFYERHGFKQGFVVYYGRRGA